MASSDAAKVNGDIWRLHAHLVSPSQETIAHLVNFYLKTSN
jgi:hypothetical protein